MGKYCEGPVYNRFMCNLCRKPINKDEIMIGCHFSERFNMGSLSLIGSPHFHKECAEKVFGKWMNTGPLYWNTLIKKFEDADTNYKY